MNSSIKKFLQRHEMEDYLVDPKFKKLIDLINGSFADYESQIERMTNTLDVSLKKTLELNKEIKSNAEQDFKSLVEGFPGLVTWFNKDLQYIGVNKNFLDFTNSSKDRFVGKKMGEVFYSNDSDLIRNFHDFVKSDEVSSQGRFNVVIQEQNFKIISHFQKVNNGEIIIIASVDVTNEYKIQEELNKQNEMAIKNSKLTAIGEMSAGIAHEINNPLMILSGNANQILTTLNNESLTAEEKLEIVRLKSQKICNMSERINKIVKGLKYISRDGTNDVFEMVTFEYIFNSTFELCAERIKFNEIKFNIIGNKEVVLSCQQSLVSQVILNLLNNSIDAISDLSNKWISVEIVETQSYIDIKFSDSGEGISKEIDEKIFQPFYTTKEVGKGTGLGLSISKAIIEKQHGQLYLDKQCKNTCFVIRFPVPSYKHESLAG